MCLDCLWLMACAKTVEQRKCVQGWRLRKALKAKLEAQEAGRHLRASKSLSTNSALEVSKLIEQHAIFTAAIVPSPLSQRKPLHVDGKQCFAYSCLWRLHPVCGKTHDRLAAELLCTTCNQLNVVLLRPVFQERCAMIRLLNCAKRVWSARGTR